MANDLDGKWKEMLDQLLEEFEQELKEILEKNKIKDNKGRRKGS